MDEAPQITLRCSELVNWARCEASAWDRTFNHRVRPERAEHIAAWIGSAVHARLAGCPAPMFPKAVRFDGITPGVREAWLQVDAMTLAVRLRLEEMRFEEHEVTFPAMPWPNFPPNVRLTGTCDLVASYMGDTVIADLKTSKEFHHSWLQLGAYALMAKTRAVMARSDETPMQAATVTKLATIHCPRPHDPLEPPTADIHWNENMNRCIEAASNLLCRIGEVMAEPHKLIPAPGNFCRFCEHPTCVVRTIAAHPSLGDSE